MWEFWWKLWNRGVDIGVGVVTSIIVGLIGLAFWQVKLWLDLRADKEKQLQQDRIKKQIEREDRLNEQRERYEKLTQQRESFAAIAEGGTLGRVGQMNHWNHVQEWMKSNDLHELPANTARFHELADWGNKLRDTERDDNAAQNAKNMARMIREIQIPPVQSG